MHAALPSADPVDYVAVSVDFTFDPGNSRRCVDVSIVDDDILEATENFFGDLTTTDPAVTLNPDRAQVDINEDPNDGKLLIESESSFHHTGHLVHYKYTGPQ